MKNTAGIFWAGIGLAVCALAIGALATSPRAFSEQYTDKKAGDNGSFEVSKNGLPANWLVYTQRTAGSGSFSVATDNTVAHTGKQSVKMAVTQCSDKGGRSSPGIAKEYEVAPGNYEITYWTKNSGTKYRLQVSGVTATTSANGPTDIANPGNTDWTKHTLKYQLPANMKRLRVELNVLSAGTLWVDDVQVTKAP